MASTVLHVPTSLDSGPATVFGVGGAARATTSRIMGSRSTLGAFQRHRRLGSGGKHSVASSVLRSCAGLSAGADDLLGVSYHPLATCVQGYLAHKKTPSLQDYRRALGLGLL